MEVAASESAKKLYEEDFYAWTQQVADALRHGRIGEVDIGNVAEELDSLGRRDRREVMNRVRLLLMHLVKWTYHPDRRVA